MCNIPNIVVNTYTQPVKGISLQCWFPHNWVFASFSLSNVWDLFFPHNTDSSVRIRESAFEEVPQLFFLTPTKNFQVLVTEMVNNLPAMREYWVRSLGREDTLERGMATHSSILAWRIPWSEDPGGLPRLRVGHDWVTNTHTHRNLEPLNGEERQVNGILQC